MSTTETIVIRIAGDSGDGVQLVGQQLTLSAALAGKDVRTLPDFPAEIRAPGGTVAGVSGYQLAISEHPIYTAGEQLDVLVALNPAVLKQALPYLKQDGVLIINDDHFTPKDWDKAGLSADLLEKESNRFQILSIPLTTLALEATADLALTKPQAKKCKNFLVLGVVLWLFDLPMTHCQAFIRKKFQAKAEIAQGNELALQAGYHYAQTLELAKRNQFHLGQVQRATGDYRQITGIEAVGLALATLAVKTKTSVLVSGYPITPSSAILQECSKLSEFGVALFQAEDEIAAIGACLGAAYGGKLALTSTSGPGMDLKSESLGLAVAAELPLVVLDVQRAGTSTGLPTKTGQSDLQLALYGRHGEAPLPVLAACSPSDCFNTVLEAFVLAVKYMTPVIVLLDAYLANAAEPWSIPNVEDLVVPDLVFNRDPQPFARNENLARSWNIPGTPGYLHQLGGLEKQGEKGGVSYDAENHQAMINLREKKIQGAAQDYPPVAILGNPEAKTLLLSWGSTYGSILAALDRCQEQGLDVAYIHLRHLYPLPKELREIMLGYDVILSAELNSGQFSEILRSLSLRDIKAITQCNGQPFRVDELVQAIQKGANHEPRIQA